MLNIDNYTNVPYNKAYEPFLKGKDADAGGGTITDDMISAAFFYKATRDNATDIA